VALFNTITIMMQGMATEKNTASKRLHRGNSVAHNFIFSPRHFF
jgi:hypothetical protein